MSLADYGRKWEYLSNEHEIVGRKVREILDNYGNNKPIKYLAYAILGTYGAGKTQFLYHIHGHAIQRNIIPIYCIAEDLFREILVEQRPWTPGDLYSLVEDKLSRVIELLSAGNEPETTDILDPRAKIRKDSPDVMQTVLGTFSGKVPEKPKVILLVDELEGQYGNLQRIVQTVDRSPLREWLESKTHLKFLAFAPAGIYELGGADRDRVKRVVLPPADVKYVRQNLINDAGKSNSCWWLSRGKARQLFKCVDVLNTVKDSHDASIVSRVIKQQLDPIGQPPTEVPPALTDKIPPSKIPCLFRLSPESGEKRRRYVINAEQLETGEFAEKLIEAFGLTKDNAVLISEYFKKTLYALSDDHWIVYIDEHDLPELFCLVLDHFLEYEHGDPERAKTFGEILSLYDRSRKESAAVHGIIGRVWEHKESEYELPLAIEEIRRAFPFPTMNPIVKDYVPDEMKQKWEGQSLPLWMWKEGNLSILFFASARDLEAYSTTDEFLSLSLPDGNGVLCLLSSEGESKEETRTSMLRWLKDNDKLRIVKLQSLLVDFLLSASGELVDVPGDLQKTLGTFKENREDVLLSRKTEIYSKALEDTVKDELPRPKTYCGETPPDATAIWGKGQLESREIAVCGVALAFAGLKLEERGMLADLRELFRGGREGRGAGDLHYLLPSRGGYSTLPDDLLPRLGKKKELRDAEPVSRLGSYWKTSDRRSLENLGRILSLEDFLKIHSDEDTSRLLEALWRATRGEFEAEEVDELVGRLQQDIISTLEECGELEEMAHGLGLGGIDFEEQEVAVKSLASFQKLAEILEKASGFSPLTKSIVALLAGNIDDISDDMRELRNLSGNARRALEELKESAANLERNLYDYKKAIKFIGLSKKNLMAMIEEQKRMDGTLGLSEIEQQAKEKGGHLDSLSIRLEDLEDKLSQVEAALSNIRGGA